MLRSGLLVLIHAGVSCKLCATLSDASHDFKNSDKTVHTQLR